MKCISENTLQKEHGNAIKMNVRSEKNEKNFCVVADSVYSVDAF